MNVSNGKRASFSCVLTASAVVGSSTFIWVQVFSCACQTVNAAQKLGCIRRTYLGGFSFIV